MVVWGSRQSLSRWIFKKNISTHASSSQVVSFSTPTAFGRKNTGMSMEVMLVTIVSKLGYNLFRGRIQPTYLLGL